MAESSENLLRQTSRTFYLTLRVLPAAVRPQISLAYLLARTTDTIADTEILPPTDRLAALQKLHERILDTVATPLDFDKLARQQCLPAERLLLEQVETSLADLQNLSPADRSLVRAVLDTITSGQELDLQRFAGATVENIIALRTDAELDDYTYRVAGCVGEFWTKICRAHVFPNTALDDARLIAEGIRFGKGLQLVNILRDLPADLRKGRCYLPVEKLTALGLSPQDLLDPANEPKLRQLYHAHLDLAKAHLAAGWNYTNSLPWRCTRLRVACAWPILIGAQTIGQLRLANILDASQRVKISRGAVRTLILGSMLRYPFPGAWRKQFLAQNCNH